MRDRERKYFRQVACAGLYSPDLTHWFGCCRWLSVLFKRTGGCLVCSVLHGYMAQCMNATCLAASPLRISVLHVFLGGAVLFPPGPRGAAADGSTPAAERESDRGTSSLWRGTSPWQPVCALPLAGFAKRHVVRADLPVPCAHFVCRLCV
jgi:hypothetical protein